MAKQFKICTSGEESCTQNIRCKSLASIEKEIPLEIAAQITSVKYT